MFSLIAAIGKNRELGKNGELVFHLPEDMKYFKDTTMGHKVLMGRKTWESLPKKLANRENIVVTRSPKEAFFGARPGRLSSQGPGAHALMRPKGHSSNSASPSKGFLLDSSDTDYSRAQCDEVGKNADFENEDTPDLVISSLKDFAEENKDSEEEIFVIGGGMVYWEMMKYANRLYLTEVDAGVEADTFFPEFDKSEWNRTVIKEGEDNGIKYAFVLYERK